MADEAPPGGSEPPDGGGLRGLPALTFREIVAEIHPDCPAAVVEPAAVTGSLDAGVHSPPIQPGPFYVVKVPQTGPPSCQEFVDALEAAHYLGGQYDQDCWCFVFRGVRLFMTCPPDQSLVDSSAGVVTRVGPPPAAPEIDPTGSMRRSAVVEPDI